MDHSKSVQSKGWRGREDYFFVFLPPGGIILWWMVGEHQQKTAERKKTCCTRYFFHLLGLWIASADWAKFAHSFREKTVQNGGKCNRKQKGLEINLIN
jgi:hypothetical protein